MGKPDAPEGPDYDKLLQMTEMNIRSNEKMFDQYMGFMKPMVNQQMNRAEQQWDATRGAVEASADLSKNMIQRYENHGIPLENQYARQLTNWDSKERRNEAAAQATQDVTRAFTAQRENMSRQLESYGIDPSQVRHGALDARMRTEQALGQASAATNARRQVEREGLAMQGEAVNIYKGLPSTAATSLGSGSSAGQQSLMGMGQAGQMGLQGYGLASGMIAQNNEMLNNSYGTANNIYGNELAAWEVGMANSPINTIGGLAGTWLGAGMPGFEHGGYVDPAMSPSGGAIPDDVPARVSAGEVILPEEVVRYHGLKNINKLVKEAQGDGRNNGGATAPYNPQRNRPVDLPGGDQATEYTATSQAPDGSWMVHPQMWWEKDGDPVYHGGDVGRETALTYEQRTNRPMPRFPSQPAADRYAAHRSRMGGGTQGAIPEDRP